jgi:hypothetical protein
MTEQPANTTKTPLLDDFARFTGGRHSVINNAFDLDQIINLIAVAIRNSFGLTDDSTKVSRDGSYRQIDVEVSTWGISKSPVIATAISLRGLERGFYYCSSEQIHITRDYPCARLTFYMEWIEALS